MNFKNLKMMLYIALFFVLGMLWMKWEAVNTPEKTTQSAPQTSVQAPADTMDVAPPSASDTATQKNAQLPPVKSTSTINPSQLVHVKTDVLNAEIDLQSGSIVSAKLLKYPVKLGSKIPLQLLSHAQNTSYTAKSGLLGPGIPKNGITYTSAQSQYQLTGQSLDVVLNGKTDNGMSVKKIFTFQKDHYTVGVKFVVNNASAKPWSGRLYGMLLREPSHSGNLISSFTTYTGAAYSTPDKHYKKLSYKSIKEEQFNQPHVKGGWVAMQQHYFLSAWVPSQKVENQIYSTYHQGHYGIASASPAQVVKPGQSATFSGKFYVGPAVAQRLNHAAPHLGLAVDYGWLWFLSDIVFWAMSLIHAFVGNWGWSIVLVTVLIKLIFYPLSTKSYVSMAKMRVLQPKIALIKERCDGDKQKLSRETMELYRKEKVNPLGGCLPMLIQIPVFIALYWVLLESVELRQAPFIFWIKDLAVKDPYYILPVLMGVSMYVQQLLNPTPPDKTQATLMKFLPVVFTVMFLHFPAGLVLYWLVNNIVSVSQQWWITRKYINASDSKKKTPRKFKLRRSKSSA